MSGIAWVRVVVALHDALAASFPLAWPDATRRPLLYLTTEGWAVNATQPSDVVTVGWSGDVDETEASDAGTAAHAFTTLRPSGRERDESGDLMVRIDCARSTPREALSALDAVTKVIEDTYRQAPSLTGVTGLRSLSLRTGDYRPACAYDESHMASALLTVAYTARV